MFIFGLKNIPQRLWDVFCLINGSAHDLQHRRRVEALLHHRRQHQGEQDARKLLRGELLGKGVRTDFGIVAQHAAQSVQNVLPCLPHLLLAAGSVLLHKAQRVVGEEAGILLAAVFHLPVHPLDAGQGVLKHGFVLRVAEDVVPDAFHCRAYQLGLGAEVVVDAAHGDPTGCGDRTDVDRCPAVLLDQLPAGFQDVRFGRCHWIRKLTSQHERCSRCIVYSGGWRLSRGK